MAAHHLLDGLERVLVEGVGIDVEHGRAGEQAKAVMMEVKMAIGAADIDHGRVAHALLKQAGERPGEAADRNIGQLVSLQAGLAVFRCAARLMGIENRTGYATGFKPWQAGPERALR